MRKEVSDSCYTIVVPSECPWNYDAPRNVIQKAVDDAVANSDWCRLELIIVKLGLHCDCSNVPLEQVLKSGVEADTLLPELLDAGASPNGSPQCEKPPLLLALESGNLGAAGELVDYGADLACAFIAQSVDARRQLHEEVWPVKSNLGKNCNLLVNSLVNQLISQSSN